MVVQTEVGCWNPEIRDSESGSLPSRNRTIIVSPSQDLFILQLDDPDMLSWSLLGDITPIDKVPDSMHIRHVGWQYHPAWASSLQESPWIGNFDSLYSYIVYGVRFGGLETLWLVNWRIKKKHWVSRKDEVEEPHLKVFETGHLRFTEVVLDESIPSLDQLRWDEVDAEDDAYTVTDFLAFVWQLQLLVSHVLTSVRDIDMTRRFMNIKILACEDSPQTVERG
ncbi:unnamed protein product [Fusarium langsethiae]|nr:unnamed protein product [Fusarium langsethiae]